jgi:hypothetical protein
LHTATADIKANEASLDYIKQQKRIRNMKLQVQEQLFNDCELLGTTTTTMTMTTTTTTTTTITTTTTTTLLCSK